MTYDAETKARAVALGMLHGADAAHRQMGPGAPSRRQISRWLAGQQIDSPLIEAVVIESKEAVAGVLWQVIAEGTAEMRRRIGAPKTRAGELAQMLKVAVEAHALLSGGPTARTETVVTGPDVPVEVTPDMERRLFAWARAVRDATDDEIRADLLEPGSLEKMRMMVDAIANGPGSGGDDA
jgi:hypothetical protein